MKELALEVVRGILVFAGIAVGIFGTIAVGSQFGVLPAIVLAVVILGATLGAVNHYSFGGGAR